MEGKTEGWGWGVVEGKTEGWGGVERKTKLGNENRSGARASIKVIIS